MFHKQQANWILYVSATLLSKILDTFPILHHSAVQEISGLEIILGENATFLRGLTLVSNTMVSGLTSIYVFDSFHLNGNHGHINSVPPYHLLSTIALSNPRLRSQHWWHNWDVSPAVLSTHHIVLHYVPCKAVSSPMSSSPLSVCFSSSASTQCCHAAALLAAAACSGSLAFSLSRFM